MTWLIDVNILVALAIDTHVLKDRASRWFDRLAEDEKFATCAMTQGSLLRIHMATAEVTTATVAWEVLNQISNHPKHVWWESNLNYLDVPARGIVGYKQVTDAWLAQLARQNGGKLATMDSGLANLHSDVAVLIPE